jgi:hypothetical protein
MTSRKIAENDDRIRGQSVAIVMRVNAANTVYRFGGWDVCLLQPGNCGRRSAIELFRTRELAEIMY